MNPTPTRPWWNTALRLGRVSNLPTVWSNVLTGVALGGEAPSVHRCVPLAVAMSLFYVGGMYLNDAFDAPWDATNRRDRPIPAGDVSQKSVLLAGFAMLFGGWALLAVVAGPAAIVAGFVLGVLIVVYDLAHKHNPWSPVLMGSCRAAIYVTCALAVTPRLFPGVLAGAGLLLAYLCGLTYVAKHEIKPRVENLWPLLVLLVPFVVLAPTVRLGWPQALLLLLFAGWTLFALSFLRGVRARPDVPRAVVSLIAGISLLDAVILGAEGTAAFVVAVAAFGVTLAFQRLVPGT